MILYYRNNKKRDVIKGETFRDAVESLYRGLEAQKKLGRRVFNLNEGSPIYFTFNNKEYSFIPKESTAHEILVRYSHLGL